MLPVCQFKDWVSMYCCCSVVRVFLVL